MIKKDSQLNLQLGNFKANANNFWIAIAFIIAFTICFITWCISSSITKVTNQYFQTLTELTIKINSSQKP